MNWLEHAERLAAVLGTMPCRCRLAEFWPVFNPKENIKRQPYECGRCKVLREFTEAKQQACTHARKRSVCGRHTECNDCGVVLSAEDTNKQRDAETS
jgi:hypothetical protein